MRWRIGGTAAWKLLLSRQVQIGCVGGGSRRRCRLQVRARGGAAACRVAARRGHARELPDKNCTFAHRHHQALQSIKNQRGSALSRSHQSITSPSKSHLAAAVALATLLAANATVETTCNAAAGTDARVDYGFCVSELSKVAGRMPSWPGRRSPAWTRRRGKRWGRLHGYHRSHQVMHSEFTCSFL
ncbi:putative invertase inhibitor [Panicum miliaceum]|uniref:Invertase inhibitor n=1 Tax=Panicum miliaceum TaxID=4540 RepID=A0A3L6RXI2_PANMI|nr:putative invertase inhibitor [Panicum miliaceum]